MQGLTMNKLPKYGIVALIALYLGCINPIYGQFMRTHISLPPGIELRSSGLSRQIIPTEDASSLNGQETTWIELRAMVNLQLVVDYDVGIALIPLEGELTVLNDGSENFANAKPTGGKGFVLVTNPRRTVVSRSGFRPYSVWLGIPFHRAWRTTIHYP